MVHLEQLELDRTPLAVRRRMIELALFPVVLDAAGQVVMTNEERPGSQPFGERPRRGSDIGNGVGDLHDLPEWRGVGHGDASVLRVPETADSKPGAAEVSRLVERQDR